MSFKNPYFLLKYDINKKLIRKDNKNVIFSFKVFKFENLFLLFKV
jgi:hypothetical protein